MSETKIPYSILTDLLDVIMKVGPNPYIPLDVRVALNEATNRAISEVGEYIRLTSNPIL